MNADRGPFEVDENGDNRFEGLAKTNGTRYWYARDLMSALGYTNWTGFSKIVNRAIGVCMTLGINVTENFIQSTRTLGGKQVEDFKLSRFACCLTAMNGDAKKAHVAAAQAYFASLATVVQDLPLSPESADRIVTREEISEREITLNAAAAAAGVEFYDRFQNSGYRGMYNMDYRDLKRKKGIPDMRRSLLDFMNKEELAANLFRLTLTEGRIRKDRLRGQHAAQDAAVQVGRRVRQTMIEETGVRPEDLPITTDIRITRRALKDTHRGFGPIDDLDQQRIYEREALAALPAPSREIVPGCAECEAGSSYSHFGSPQCSSGSLASGGPVAHCSCDYCSNVS